MKPEKQRLIHDVLGDGGCREATLMAGRQILRRRRRVHAVSRAIALVAVLGLAGIWIGRMNSPKPEVRVAVQTTVPVVMERPQAMTDEQLLAMFPNTPVALAKLADGRKRLIFPRAGDDRRFVTRM